MKHTQSLKAAYEGHGHVMRLMCSEFVSICPSISKFIVYNSAQFHSEPTWLSSFLQVIYSFV